MISDKQARRIAKMRQKGNTLETVALKSGVSVNTVKKYLMSGLLPDEMKIPHTWVTRQDPFDSVWPDLRQRLSLEPGLEAKTLFDYLQRIYPGRYSDGQIRTLQRKVKSWRVTEGEKKEIMFPQVHKPGEIGASDFTNMNKLNITLDGQAFPHLIYHFVLTCSNWETGSVCFSESFASLSEGVQNALWELGGVPERHRTDRLSTAVHNIGKDKGSFTRRYQELLDYYGLKGERTQAASPNENGDIEQRNYRFKSAIEQELLFRGNRNFKDLSEYKDFLSIMFKRLNAGREKMFQEELTKLKKLPVRRYDSTYEIKVRVGPSSTIRAIHNTYSVDSRLINQMVKVRVHLEYLDVWFGQRHIERLPRLRGESNSRIDYRHIIHSLVRKPGAFTNYRYRDHLFPTSRFRITYDLFRDYWPQTAHHRYLRVLLLAATDGENAVEIILGQLINANVRFDEKDVSNHLSKSRKQRNVYDVKIDESVLADYDCLVIKQ